MVEIKLPQEAVKKSQINPKTMVLFGKPKIGKSTAISKLENCLLIDLEGGSNYLDALKIDILKLSKEQDTTPISILKQVINQIKEANKKAGKFIYKFGAIDTITALEKHVLIVANKLYQNTTQGKNWQGDDVTTLGNGAGYQYTRRALWMVLEELEECFEHLIILGHLKDKLIEKEGKEMNERGLSLTGLSSSILCGNVDAVGYMYRDDNKTMINFKPTESLTVGSRSEHLEGEKITLIESDKDGNLTVDWSKIFINK